MKANFRLFVAVVVVSLISSSCASLGTQSNSPAPPVAAKLQPGDLKKLAWIVGTWKGTGDNVEPFYERYRFEGDQALVMETLADASLTTVKSVTRYELKDGRLQGGNEWTSVAIELNDKSVTFAPVTKGNTFQWVYKDANSWDAILDWPAPNDPNRKMIYRLERVSASPAAPAKGN
jgi:hypothetical protein